MPFCSQCGVDNPAAARFCDQCGAALIPVAASSAATAPAAVAVPAASSTVICPQCGTAAIPGEAYCDNCGAPLAAPANTTAAIPMPPAGPSAPPQPTYQPPRPVSMPPTTPAPAASAPPAQAAPVRPAAPSPQRTALAPTQLVLAKTGTPLPLPNAAQAIIGRADPVSQFTPDVDLLSYEALEQGVGRRHARLFVQNGQMLIEDLDSTNGTFLNGQRLPARQPQQVQVGDQLQLGRLLLRVQ